MFITKIVLIVLFTFDIVRCSELSKDDKRSEKQVGRYNVPSESIVPVAIISDDSDNRKGKSIETEVSKFPKIKFLAGKNSKNENPTLFKVSSSFAVKPSENNKIKAGTKTLTDDDLQIPVAVVYEEPATPRIQKKVLLRRKSTNRGVTSNRNIKDLKTTAKPDKVVEYTTAPPNNNVVTSSEKPISTRQLENDANQKRTRERDPVIPIIQSENRVFAHNGDFHYSYEGGDGTKAFGTGELKTFDNDKTGEAVVGGFSYTAKDGQDYSLSYTADENGYRPVGDHLPTPPPIPPAIERALRYLATKTTPEPVTDSVSKSN